MFTFFKRVKPIEGYEVLSPLPTQMAKFPPPDALEFMERADDLLQRQYNARAEHHLDFLIELSRPYPLWHDFYSRLKVRRNNFRVIMGKPAP